MSLHAAYDPDNIFAKIIRGEMPCVKVYEDDDILSFMDIFPQTEGHCLVIPKAAGATNLLDAPAEMLGTVIAGTQRIARAVAASLKPDGVRIAQFNGAPAGQTVYHLHFHILPVYEGRAVAAHENAGPAATGELKALAEKIRAAL